eukprot:scaffold28318_cov125-Skeletonema_marinoi.AAC.3
MLHTTPISRPIPVTVALRQFEYLCSREAAIVLPLNERSIDLEMLRFLLLLLCSGNVVIFRVSSELRDSQLTSTQLQLEQ